MSRVVFDSASGGCCPRCRKRLAKCRCGQQIAASVRPRGDGVVRVRREVRNGKPMTVVLGLPLLPAELTALAAKWKSACGTGGTAKDGVIEIQGDHRERLVALLRADGHQVVLAGG